MNDITDKVVWVTGSSRGIGAGIARVFAQQGARVALHGRDRQALQAIQAEIAASDGRAMIVEGDITKYAEIEHARLEIERDLGPIDVLIANAGGSFTPPGPLEDTSEDGWRASLDRNLTTTLLNLKSVLPGMKQRRQGSIITMSSVAGHWPHPRTPIPYAAAKAGIEMLTKQVAAQVGPFGIRVNCIAPETILTERNTQRIPPDLQRSLIDVHPIRRLGTVEDIARLALRLGILAVVAAGAAGALAGNPNLGGARCHRRQRTG